MTGIFHEIKLRKIPPSPVGVFYFGQSSPKMNHDYQSRIDSVFSVLQRNEHMNIAVVGHTSAEGSAHLNRSLSLKRAKAIRKLLVRNGVDDMRITTTGVGSAQPKSTRETEERQPLNRRVEVFLRE